MVKPGDDIFCLRMISRDDDGNVFFRFRSLSHDLCRFEIIAFLNLHLACGHKTDEAPREGCLICVAVYLCINFVTVPSGWPERLIRKNISCHHRMLGAGEGDGCHGGVAISNVDLGNDGLWGVLDLTEGVAHLRMLKG